MAEHDADMPRRRRPAAVRVSPRDRDALERGGQPSWLETADVRERPVPAATGPNDRRLLEDVPPHY